MHRARRNLGTQLLMLLIVLTGLYFGYSFAREVVQAQRLAAQAAGSRQENDQLAAENRKLARDLQYYQSDAYAELRARTDLNMRRPDEQIILPVLPAEPANALPAAGATPGPGSPAPPPPMAGATGATAALPPPAGRNWDRWLGLFNNPGR